MQKDSRNLWVIVSAALTLGWASCVDATVQTERVTFRASLSTQNTFQHDSTESFDWVQWRNEVRLELKYRLLPPGRERGILRNADFQMLYRGRFDPVFQIRDTYRERLYDRDDFVFPEGKYPRGG